MMRRFILPLILIFLTLNMWGQYLNVEVSPPGGGVNEPSIMISPEDPDIIVAACNNNYYFHSSDGGLSWNTGILQSPYGVNGDPCIIVDTAGYFYYLHLSYPPNGSWIDRIVCQRSVNGGLSWNNGSYMGLNPPKKQDKEWAVVDPLNNNIYVTWTQFDAYGSSNPMDSTIILFSKSTDMGDTWAAPIRISRKAGDCVDSDSTVEGAVPAVGPAGEIYTSWAGPEGLLFNRSLNQGAAWLDTNIFVSDIPGGWDYPVPGIYRCNGLPVTCCDISGGPYRGNIYINWTDQRNGETDTDVWFKKSTDGGNTWGPLKRINDDPPGKHQFFTWMTIDQVTGFIYIVFYDRRNYSDEKTDVYMAVSKDGGETFTNEMISSSPFDPNENIFFGDYTNISAHNNRIRPIWTRLDNTTNSIITAIIDDTTATGTGQKPVPMVAITMDQLFPNPGTDKTYISFKLPDPQYVTLTVTDVYGKEIARIIDHVKLERGKHFSSFDIAGHQLAPGVYLFRLTGDGQSIVRKMTVER